MDDTFAKLQTKLSAWFDELVLLLPNAVLAILALFAIAGASRIIGAAAYRVVSRVSTHTALNSLVRRFLRVAGWMVGFAVALQILHLDKAVTTFLAGAGLVGLAIGFAFQDISANFIAGIYLTIKHPIDVDDVVKTNDVFGVVVAIELRSSVIRTMDGQLVHVPNRKIFEAPLVNYSKLGQRRVEIKVGVPYDADLAKATATLTRALTTLERSDDLPLEVFATEFGESSIDFVARFWIPYVTDADFLRARSAAVIAIKRELDADKISIPFPIRTIDLPKAA